MTKSLNIFEFSEYRGFLKSWLEEAKALKTSNLTRLAEAAMVHPTFLSHVLAGTKELSLEQAALISDYMNLTQLEQDFFFAIIQIDRAGNQKLKKYWEDKKVELEKQKNKLSERLDKHRQLSHEQRAVFYSSWLYTAIWASTAIDDGQNLNQIAERFQISRNKAEEIVNFLLETGLCNEKNGMISIGETHVHIPNESPLVVKHHTNWRMKAVQKMDTREGAELFFTAPMSIAKKDFDVIREKLNVALKEVVDVAKDSPAEEVVCLNIDFFHTK